MFPIQSQYLLVTKSRMEAWFGFFDICVRYPVSRSQMLNSIGIAKIFAFIQVCTHYSYRQRHIASHQQTRVRWMAHLDKSFLWIHGFHQLSPTIESATHHHSRQDFCYVILNHWHWSLEGGYMYKRLYM